MKRIKLILSFFMINLFMTGNAQLVKNNFEINWYKDQKPFKEGYMTNFRILKTDSGYIYYYMKTMRAFKHSHFLVKYDRKSSEYEWLDITPDEDNKLTLLSGDTLNNSFHVYQYFNNKLHKKLYLFDESYDYVNLKKKHDIKKISEIDLSDNGSQFDNMFMITNNNRVMFRYSCFSNKGKFYGLEVLNRQLEREWGTYHMATTEPGYNIESNYKIDYEGNVYAIQRNFEKESDIKRHYNRSRIWAVCYPNDGSESRSVALILKDDLFVTAEQLSINNNNQIICAGLYAKPGTESAVGGFSFVIEPKLSKIRSVQTKEFSKDLITKGVDSKKKQKDLKKIISQTDFEKNFGYSLNDIHFRSDGGFDLVAEKYYRLIVTSNHFTNTYHHYDDLWVLNFKADGSFKWVQKIPKYEYVVNEYDKIGSYFLFHDENEALNFVFNLANCYLYKRNSTAISIKLDKDGNESFNELIVDKEITTVFSPKYSFQEKNGDIVISRFNNVKSMTTIPGKNNFLTFGELKFQ